MSTFPTSPISSTGPIADWGQISCGCHPNCGIGMVVMCDKETKESVPLTAFLNTDQLMRDVTTLERRRPQPEVDVSPSASALRCCAITIPSKPRPISRS